MPARRLGKKAGTLAMLEAKLPPPMPESVARTAKVEKGVWVSRRASPAPRAGTISRAVVTATVFLPPASGTRNALGMRRVAPASPAMLMRVKSWAGVKGKPASRMRTARMDQNIHTEKATRRAGTETARLRQATAFWPDSQAAGSSGFHEVIGVMRAPG